MSSQLADLPAEMIAFALLRPSAPLAPRTGRLQIPGRKTLLTPHYIANTSRGAVPHISQDNFRKNTNIDGVYVALEDYIEKHPQQTPPLYKVPAADGESPLRNFVGLPEETLFVLGPRRVPPVPCPGANTNTSISIFTSVGFRSVASEDYAAAAQKLRPDIVVGLADIPYGQENVGLKRKDKMSDRTENWSRDIIAHKGGLDKTVKNPRPLYNIFAPILPISKETQSWYLDHLVADMIGDVDGLAIYDSHSLGELPEELQQLPRLSFDAPKNPQRLLQQISLGMDIFTIPFISDATDAGIALNLTFPPLSPASQEEAPRQKRPLGIDMWDTSHALSVEPFTRGCACYACRKHHKAYVQHLLAAKEMLGWVLIQLHNHAIMDAFFAGVRASIEKGTFDEDVAAFDSYYQADLPEKTGQGPRVRGYQFKSSGPAESKKNPTAYRMLNDMQEQVADAPRLGENTDAKELESIGFAEAAGR